MTFPLNYKLFSNSANGNVKKGDVINHASLKGDVGTGTDLAAQLERNQAYRLHKPLIACGALGQTITITVDVANGAQVTNAMAIEAVVYENTPETVQIQYFDRKYGFGKGIPVKSPSLEASMERQESVFSVIGDVATLSGDARFSYDPDAAAGTAILTITPNGTDVILLRSGARFGALGDIS